VTDRIDFLSAIEEGESRLRRRMRSWVPTASLSDELVSCRFQNRSSR